MVSHKIHNNTFKNGRRELRGALQLAVERPEVPTISIRVRAQGAIPERLASRYAARYERSPHQHPGHTK